MTLVALPDPTPMDEVVEIAHQSGRLAGKAANTIGKLATEHGLADKLQQQTAAVRDKYHDQTGRRLSTDAKIAGITGAAAVTAAVASLVPAVVVAGAAGAAAYEVASESELAQRARTAYEEKLGRDLARDKEAVKACARAGIVSAQAAGVAALHGFREVRGAAAARPQDHQQL